MSRKSKTDGRTDGLRSGGSEGRMCRADGERNGGMEGGTPVPCVLPVCQCSWAIIVAQALCLTMSNLSPAQKACLFTDGNKSSVIVRLVLVLLARCCFASAVSRAGALLSGLVMRCTPQHALRARAAIAEPPRRQGEERHRPVRQV